MPTVALVGMNIGILVTKIPWFSGGTGAALGDCPRRSPCSLLLFLWLVHHYIPPQVSVAVFGTKMATFGHAPFAGSV
jgi:hypothetical protein